MATRRAFAQEDTDLNTSSVTSSRVKEYIDIDLTFQAKPTSGEIFKKKDAAAVKQAIKTLVMTNLLEKPFDPFFGGDIRGQLFELADRNGSSILRDNIIDNLEAYEPRAEVLDVVVDLYPDNHTLNVTVKFKVVNTEEQVEFTTRLSRLR
jgi:phage baseplate assembly protein W